MPSSFIRIISKLNPFGYVFLITGVGVYSIRYDLSKYFYVDDRLTFLLSVGLIGYGVAILLLNYLKGDKYQSAEDGLLMDELKVLRNELVHSQISKSELEETKKKIHALENLIKYLKEEKYQITSDERHEILESLRSNILTESSSALMKEIELKYSESIKADNQLNRVREQLEGTRLRLRGEIAALGRRGNVNLVIGVLTTIVAVGILANTVLNLELKLPSETLIAHLAPRITLSLFIEVFSFFFLKLYKSGLSEIKYFQNELTNVEMKFISLDICLRGKNTELISDVVSEFSKTERNFILNKGQTTVEIERGKLDNEVINNAVSSFSKFVEVIKK
ncbi:hypothetical protein J4H00_01040 [Enterobacter ludwigii]|uniref:hypothetical protein n=1 Tax=Enterobacter ludwigii TaxID=299767 RepID=UPI001A9FE3EC|nr:hypothetical protein [Enterobacter ludwigii]MBO1466995.1 hypothetical protein [Enterobacter ludwigii]MBO1525873.1 hypothetical protein [Enterobacter ludwigii]